MTTPEGKVKAAVKKRLKELGVWHYMPVQNGMGVVGIPDLICCAPVIITEDMIGMELGLFVAIETKAPGKRKNTTPNQDRNIHAIQEHGGFADVVDNVDELDGLPWVQMVKGEW